MEAAEQGGKAAQEGEAKKERSTGHNPEECPVCMEVFNDTVQRPRTLPCGHTVCTLCINKLKQQGIVVCPECRIRHPVPDGGQFPICYTVEALIRRMGSASISGPSRKMRSSLHEEEATAAAPITACQEVQAPVDQYQTTLRGWGEQQQQLEAEDLRSPTQPVRRLLEAGRVFGFHQVEGQRRHARISLEAGKVYLHILKEEPLPPGASAVEVSELVSPSPSFVLFMDLSWSGSAPRRVHFRVSHDIPRGRQMGEFVSGGDYEINEVNGVATLQPVLDKDEYRRSGKAVDGWGVLRGGPLMSAEFFIRTRDRQDGSGYDDLFVEVVEGQDALLRAAQHAPITDVTIVDCGVVL